MRILIIGYGKMGKMIEQIAKERGHQIAGVVDINDSLDSVSKEDVDVAIDFTIPSSVMNNIHTCLDKDIPLVVGTTGWYDNLPMVQERVEKENKSLFFSPNFAIGVYLFRQMNKYLAKMMDSYNNYTPSITEIHHIHKLDAPSGTAITIANELLQEYSWKKEWKLDAQEGDSEMKILAIREGEEFGTHIVTYESQEDIIEIKHKAKSRRGLALGAVMAAEFLQDKRGFYTMKDLIQD